MSPIAWVALGFVAWLALGALTACWFHSLVGK